MRVKGPGVKICLESVGIWTKSLPPSLGPSSLTRQSLKTPVVTGPGHLTEVCASGWEGKSSPLWFSSAWYTVDTQYIPQDVNGVTVTQLLLTAAKKANPGSHVFGYLGIFLKSRLERVRPSF